MQLAPKYDPSTLEEKWYKFWETNQMFASNPDERTPYTIVIPPPNVTGVLHMGHMLNNTIQDVLIRRKRMQGFNALWVPGTDHASIATETKVVTMLKEKGIKKTDLTREKFLEYAWEWKEKHGGIILQQLRKLGASCDWSRTRFTMDEALYESVIDVFIDLYNKGLIYRGVRMVNWDPVALTAVSDEEVIYEEQQSKLYYLKYKIVGEDNFVTIATTRPETILGDTAVCVNPNDERYKDIQGKKVLVPLINREIPVIVDEYVDMEFGTGCLKITPAHDINDYNIGLKHNLESIDILNDNGTLNEKAQLYIGKDRFVAREEIVVDLEKSGHVAKIEPYINKIGLSERSHAPIEPKLSLQWFLKMKEMAKPALDVVENDIVKFHPAKFKNTYRHWMENVKDWCISRQLWWGQQIPVYYLPDNSMIVAKSKEEAYQKALELNCNLKIEDLHQDEDVLDTWFSSWLWPISVFDGIRFPDNEDIKYYYPTNDLVSAPDILFFWIARMIMAGLEYRKDIPFHNVYITGVVRDKQGRKMSKSLGNSPDPLDLIEKYGADGVRVGMLLTSPAGNDLPFDEVLCEQGRNFANKIWNALRLIKGWNVDENKNQPEYSAKAFDFFDEKINASISQLDNQFKDYRISEALMTTYKLIWDDFCSWYLEIIKPPYGEGIDAKTYNQAVDFFEKLMQLLHPFMPFVTEEIWHNLKVRTDKESIMLSLMPETKETNDALLRKFDYAADVITAIRTLRLEKNIPLKEQISLFIKKNHNEQADITFDSIIAKLTNLDKIEYIDEKLEGALSFIVATTEFYVPAPSSIDIEAELEKLRAELEYTKGFLDSVNKKLNNERFVSGAPANVVELEQKKRDDANKKIAVIEEQIRSLM
ncbi:valine--tRNA ligase [Bacteroidales bacterium OttesenSCG-928-K03]|nr:valine--tRNA ligase [Odoribacter sp. OttesenSCG-928-L07]MDL2242593.1 valine--tRNA ligase [Bacteroidales bacterium OttesenSCG-928-K03]